MVVVLIQILVVVLTLISLGGLSIVLEQAVRSQWLALALIVYAAWQLVLGLALLSGLAPKKGKEAEEHRSGRAQKAEAQAVVELRS